MFQSLEHDRIVRFFGAARTLEAEPSVWLVTFLEPRSFCFDVIIIFMCFCALFVGVGTGATTIPLGMSARTPAQAKLYGHDAL